MCFDVGVGGVYVVCLFIYTCVYIGVCIGVGVVIGVEV